MNFKRKADYSRRGCLECKKSHLKCDEGLPSCQRCQKRKTICTYQTKFVLENGVVSKCESQVLPGLSVGNEKRRRTSSFKISPQTPGPTIDKISTADRSVGGMRASLYNAVSLKSVELLCKFIENFAEKHQ